MKEETNNYKHLYELERDSYFKIASTNEVNEFPILHLKRIDGMYSLCYDEQGKTYHLAAFTIVEQVDKPNNWSGIK